MSGIKAEEIGFYRAKEAKTLLAPDGKLFAIEYSFDNQVLNVALDREQTRQLIHNMSVLLSTSIGDKTPLGGPGFVATTRVTSASVNATDSPGEVLICLINELGTAHYYSMPAETSAALRPQMRRAETDAKAGIRLPRA